ncbi:TPA_asm: sigma-70 family RNA polymerase sigma factor [Listeria monocytogenes]|uniref:sigma-70 family RNA polymerase sigma factor n=1 Tax=Bacilli TaxID=91061 RepID=UPI00026C86E3|nr:MULTISPECIES: sigma-70 family RNA polymerase sigma factor [Bacilli]MBP8587244.1 sigma-70 family RNA polymerase sigma factor [Listeria monocytogenes]NVT90581.1 sigma-70 family RNA polymerase sigma factor [Listeria monocytogenes]RJB63707.1 sigma-70 family RNA polymerase sigma factor [Listeria monocytogenes]RJB84635.1 sigma-70 family RNA polymerase sigma factor [Listeria monocytogenes]CWU74779.1 sporulation sigma factor SigG [Listeria monocytogenes]
MKSEVEINYLFVSYIQQSIKNSSNACLKKKQRYSHNYFPTDTLEDIMVNSFCDSYLSFDSIQESDIITLEQFTENEALSKALGKLSLKEKRLLYEKYIQCKTDNEIATILKISRQGVSIARKRILKKLEEFLKR